MTRTNTLNAYQVFPWTRRITVRASGESTAARHLIGYALTNRIPPTPLDRRMPFVRAISALNGAVIYNKHLEPGSQFGLLLVYLRGQDLIGFT